MTNSLVSKLKRFSLFPLAIILVLSSSVFIDQKAYADDHDDKIDKWAYYKAQDSIPGPDTQDTNNIHEGCFEGIDKISGNDVTGSQLKGKGFNAKKKTLFGAVKTCSQLYTEAIPKWGFSSAEEFLKAAGYSNNSEGTWVAGPNGRQGPVNKAIRAKIGVTTDKEDKYLSPGELYTYYYKDFKTYCSLSSEAPRSKFSEGEVKLADAAKNGYISYNKISKNSNNKDVVEQVIAKYSAHKLPVYHDHGNSGTTADEPDNEGCISKSKRVTSQADKAIKAAQDSAAKDAVYNSYVSSLAPLKDKACKADQSKCQDDGWEKSIKKCYEAGYKQITLNTVIGQKEKNKDKDAVVKETLASCMHKKWPSLSEKEIKDAINKVNSKETAKNAEDQAKKDGADAAAGEGAEQAADGEETGTQCAVDGIGWLVCPVVNFLAKISSDSASILAHMLEINSGILTNRDEGSTFYYWSKMRDIANIVFIIAFLVVIYSQVTGLGISNYGIKKLLPKLLMTIVLVNLSFYVCAILIDISNIIGSSSFNFIGSLGGSGAGPEGGWSTKGSAVGDGLVGLAATAIGLTVGFFALSAVITGLIFIVVTVSVTVFLLGARQAIIIFMVILAPLAFVALLLPNTEGMFKKWWATFKTLLIIYPVIGCLYGACILGATVINNMKGETSFVLQIIGSVLTFTPLLLVSRITSMMTSMMGLANITEKMGKVAGNFVGNKAQGALERSPYGQYMQERERAKELARAQAQAGTYTGKNPFRRAQSWGMKRINDKARNIPGTIGRSVRRGQSTASRLIDQQAEDELKLSESFFENYRYLDKDGKEQALSKSDIFQLAMGEEGIQGYKRDKDGKLVKGDVLDPKAFSDFDRRYIIKEAAKSANSGQLRALTQHANDDLGSGDRAALADALLRSPAASKNPWWTGKAADQLRAGEFNYEQAVVEGALGGKYNAPKMADMDEPAFKDMMEVLNSDSISGISEDQLMRARQATGLAVDAALRSQLYNAKMQSNEAIYRRASKAREWSQDPTKRFRVMSDNAKQD
jgi:hypothetical protein cdiviTM7_00597